jgi:CMP-N,N'-diacetyllegionaminic acid synthase
MRNVLAIIPARGGSKGLPNKNVLPVDGIPMVCRAIKESLNSKLISKVIVSSDSNRIIEQSLLCGAEVPFKRPDEFSTDNAGISGVIEHAIDFLLKEDYYDPEIIVLLQANSPFVNTKVIDECINKIIEEDADVVYTVSCVEHPPYWVQNINKYGCPEFVFPKKMIPERFLRQEMPLLYRPTGTVSVSKVEYLKECFSKDKVPGYNLPISGQKTYAIKIDQITGIDIDGYLDYLLALAVVDNKVIT